MKQYIYSFLSFVILLGMAGCTSSDPDVGPAPTESNLSFTVTPTADNPNIVEFANTTNGSIAFWEFGTGATAKGDKVTAEYAVEGDYEVTMTVIMSGGQASKTQTINIAQTDFTLLDRDDYNFLTGGGSNTEGKNWVFDKATAGHMGIGDPAGEDPNWWAAEANQKEGRGAYDDVMNFNLNGFKYTLTNNGDSYAKDYMADWFTSKGGTLLADDDDHTYAIEFNDQSAWTWAISDKEDGKYLTFGGDGFPSWHTGGSEYKIMKLTEDEMYLRTIGGDGNAWYYGFVREGFERPVAPPVEKPFEANDLYDDFGGNTNTTFVTDADLIVETGIENFDQLGNPMELVGKYERTATAGEDGWWQNYQTELPYRLDLSTRNKFSMKVYFLRGNDFTTPSSAAETPDWLGEVAMSPTVALRLENTLDGGNAWQTRAEALYTMGEDDMGHWVEITFDFSDHSEKTIYDKVIIQIGGEGHTRPGTFYISDFKLL
ncbi:PKD domain-containing protein [Flammeovirga aprica]|uniref:PKD domain-containing protein n=1 Tax=Flammeovirga aprica JL-4 TaxID=694437 RepID=A0A7X9RWH0_9BACT|nr:PKD domain-containing protein [Flammeovirga aprica]NME70007.1 hypothetical protein [Flammeovirga aprica JL-4]